MIKKTLYNLQVYIEDKKVLHVVLYGRKYLNITISSTFFLAVFEEMKSCLYCVEAANAGMAL